MSGSDVRLDIHWMPVLRSGGVNGLVGSTANRLCSAANAVSPSGATYGTKVVYGSKGIAHGIVHTTDLHSMRSNAKHGTLGGIVGGA